MKVHKWKTEVAIYNIEISSKVSTTKRRSILSYTKRRFRSRRAELAKSLAGYSLREFQRTERVVRAKRLHYRIVQETAVCTADFMQSLLLSF